MKNLIKISMIPVVFITTLMLTFLFTSIVGTLFVSYKEVITNVNWFIVFTMFFGMWWSGYVCVLYYELLNFS